jgi:hypothetical protein
MAGFLGALQAGRPSDSGEQMLGRGSISKRFFTAPLFPFPSRKLRDCSSFTTKRGFYMWSRGFLIILLSAVSTFPAFAFDRSFPPGAKRGTMSPAAYPAVVINGKMRTLSLAARIWNKDNLIEVPSSLHGNEHAINYTENEQGDIDRVWILRQDEASRPLPQ